MKTAALFLSFFGLIEVYSQSPCEFRATNDVVFESFVVGRNPTNGLPRFVRFGRGSFGLTANVLSYEVRLPAIYGPYDFIFRDIVGNPHDERLRVEAAVGTVTCTEVIFPNPVSDPQDLELLPVCIVRGAVCIREAAISALLEGEWVLHVTAQNLRFEFVPIVPVDSDGDGIPDFRDACPDTTAGATINEHGCSIEQLCPCDGPWRNHGEFVNCMKRVTADFVNAGLITEGERRQRITGATASDCGRRR